MLVDAAPAPPPTSASSGPDPRASADGEVLPSGVPLELIAVTAVVGVVGGLVLARRRSRR